MLSHYSRMSFCIALAGLSLSGCGGGGSSAPAASTTNASNTSVYGRVTTVNATSNQISVNGKTFHADNAAVTVNGEPGDLEDLEPGMLVNVRANEGVVEPVANEIEFDAELEGPVSDANLDADGLGTITVMGFVVAVDANTVVRLEDGVGSLVEVVTPTGTTPTYIVEVSGFDNGDGTILATHVELESFDSEKDSMSLEGVVASFDEVANTFVVADQLVVLTDQTSLDVPAGVVFSDGLKVEVHGQLDESGRFVATSISMEEHGENEMESSDHEMMDDMDIEGIVSGLTPDQFTINDLTVAYSDTTGGVEFLVEGALVEVEAVHGDGVLMATDIEPVEDLAENSDAQAGSAAN